MATKKRFTYNENEINGQTVLVDGYYVWISFKGSAESCTLYKVSAFDCNIKYYDITVTANEIIKMNINGDYLYCVLDSDNYIALKLHRTNPLGNQTYYDKPDGETEDPVDLILETYFYILIPGTDSGTFPTLYKYNKTNTTLVEIISVTGDSGEIINNAKTMTIDSSDNIWIACYSDPIKLIKLYYDSGWLIETYDIT